VLLSQSLTPLRKKAAKKLNNICFQLQLQEEFSKTRLALTNQINIQDAIVAKVNASKCTALVFQLAKCVMKYFFIY